MQIKNNLINIICLGFFNPSILTPRFLKEVCNFKLDQSPKGRTTPVISNLEYGSLQFIIELEKLQIIEKNLSDFKLTKIPDYFNEYMKILVHTPIFVCGINLNISVTEFKLENVTKSLQNKEGILKILKTKEMKFETKEIVSVESERWLSLNVEWAEENDTTLRLNLKNNERDMIMNLNYEVANLENHRERVNKLKDNLVNLIAKQNEILKSLIGE
jgi:hypothetical protein